MKRLLSLLVLLVSISAVFAQTATLTFTGRDANNQHLPMDRVVIANATQGWQETIYYPDTVFTMGGTGIADNAANGDFGLRQNNPNPFTGTTYATLQTMDAGEAILEMTDVNGRVVETWRAASLQENNAKTNAKGVATHLFSVGNDMIHTGYVTVNGTEYQSQMIHQNQFVSETFVLNFNASAPTAATTISATARPFGRLPRTIATTPTTATCATAASTWAGTTTISTTGSVSVVFGTEFR